MTQRVEETLTVDRDRCMGSGQCTFYAPHTFDLDDDSIAVLTGDLTTDPDTDIQQAIDVCPTRAIARAAVHGRGGDTT